MSYRLPVGDRELALNDLLGARLEIRHGGLIRCIACGRRTRRSYAQGHCWRCFRTLASCDLCILSPERCHHHLGTCREPAWGEANCLRPHIVYLANSSGVKVGITQASAVPGRWIDQGASAALPVLGVATRRASGIVEAALRARFSDRTDWRAMLRGPPDPVDLEALRASVLGELPALQAALADAGVDDRPRPLDHEGPRTFRYPVARWPVRVRSLDLTRVPEIAGTLEGVKGQYLMLSCGVLNVRRHAGFEVSVRAG